MPDSNGVITGDETQRIRVSLGLMKANEEKIEKATRRIGRWRKQIGDWDQEINDLIAAADPGSQFNIGFVKGIGREFRTKPLAFMMPTNREKIRKCLENNPGGATFDQIMEETLIPEASLRSDLSARAAMGIEKQKRGKDALYLLKAGSQTR